MKRRNSRITAVITAVIIAALMPVACTHNPAPVAGDQSGTAPDVTRHGTPPPPRPFPLPPFYDPKLPVQDRVNDLVSRLTLEEKVSLMQMASPAIVRLGIAPYDWWSEALHGVASAGTATVFPQAIGMAASFDADLHYQVAQVIGMEGRAKHVAAVANNNFGRFRGLDFWSPNVNIFRDPRWGRGQETYGEDPYLSGRLAVSFVKGLQGDDPFYFQAIATPKHYAVHSGPESQRHSFDAVITDQDLYTTYLPQFEAAVREGHAYSIMSAYSALNGVPDSGNRRLLTEILRGQWGFNGYVVSDVDSVGDIYLPKSHAYVPGAAEASALAVKAGNDLNSGATYGRGEDTASGQRTRSGPSALATAVERGLISVEEVNIAVGRLMEARIRVGEFDPPGYEGNPYNKITADMNDLPQSDALAHWMADESMVLLKNAGHTLPFKTGIGTIAVIGPNANILSMQYGDYNGNPSLQHRVSILDGIRKAVGEDHVITTSGPRPPLVNDRVALAEPVTEDYLFTDASRSRHGLTATYAATPEVLSQPARTEVSQTGALNMPLPSSGIAYDPSLAAKMTGVIVPPATGDYQLGARGRAAFRIAIDNQVIVDEVQGNFSRNSGNAIHLEKDKAYNLSIDFVHSPPPPSRGRGSSLADGTSATSAPATAPAPSSVDADTEPLLQLLWTRPTADGSPADISGQNLYAEAIDLAKQADAVVLVVGIDATLESEEPGSRHVGFFGGDRTAIELPTVQENLVKQVVRAAGKKPVVVVCCSGSAIALNWANDNVPAIIQAWYPGQHGDAVADVLSGKYNPAGRLPVTFYKSTNDLPAFTDYSMVARTYRYFTRPVLYPFGHGLSYSTFEYSGLTAPARAGTGEDIRLALNVKNTGAIDGDDVVQCYLNRDLPPIDPQNLPQPSIISDEQATLASTPRKTLVGFARVPLKAGESRDVTFTITTQQLSLVVGKNGKRLVNPGPLQIQVGGSSAIGPSTLTHTLRLEGPPKAPEYHFVAPVVK